jgi:hypothetical protein
LIGRIDADVPPPPPRRRACRQKQWVSPDEADTDQTTHWRQGSPATPTDKEEKTMKKAIGAGVLGLVIGGAAGWGNMYARLQPVEQRASQAEAAREEAAKAAKALEGQLKEAQQAVEKLQAAGKATDQALGEAKGQLAAALSGKEAAEKAREAADKTAAELKGQLAAAVSAREAAEQALAEAKKSAAPAQ